MLFSSFRLEDFFFNFLVFRSLEDVSRVIVGAEGTPVVLEFGRVREGATKMAKFKLTLFRGRVENVQGIIFILFYFLFTRSRLLLSHLSSSLLHSSSENVQGAHTH